MITNQKGETIGNPRFLNKELKRLKARQKKLSRKAKGSKNRAKAKHYIAKTHAKICDKRMDFLHKVTSQIVDENQVIVVESLGVKRMLQNKKLAREIADVGWGIFLQLLAYKSSWFGRIFVQIDKYFPSSKQCHHCGTIKEKLELNERQWSCFCCGMNHDRDINAAKNILQEGLRSLGVPRGSRDFKPVELV